MDTAALSDRLEHLRQEHLVPGLQVGLMRGSDRETLCFGSLDLDGARPVTPTTSFHAGSLAKSLAGLTVLDAAHRGEIDLDVPCSEQGPGLWDDTPRALLSQTTGRPNALPSPDHTLAGFVAHVGQMPRTHSPGRFSYCNAGWSVLDLLLESRTGRGFEDRAGEVLAEVLPGEEWQPSFGMPHGAATPHAAGREGGPEAVPALFAPAASAAGSRWWASVDQLLAWGRVQLSPPAGWEDRFHTLREPAADLPGSTVFDSWGHGWASWDRGPHQAFGWCGFTGGHRAYLRCFPDQDAAVAVLANCAGPLFGPPGGSALFDKALPDVLDVLGVPPLTDPDDRGGPDPASLLGQYGPMSVRLPDSGEPGDLLLDTSFLGGETATPFVRSHGATYDVHGRPPGGMPVSFDGDLAYVGPFALPRT